MTLRDIIATGTSVVLIAPRVHYCSGSVCPAKTTQAMLGVDLVRRLLRCLCPSKSLTVEDTDSSGSSSDNENETTTGSEWLYIEEPVGFFFPSIVKRIQLLQLDQAQHLLHYGNLKHVMRLHNVSLVTAVEETDAQGLQQWWMTVQDPSALQLWVIHFPSRHRLEAWIELLRAVFSATNSRAVVNDLVFIGKIRSLQPASPVSELVPAEAIPATS